MASCNWKKYHGATESKAIIRHNDKEMRKIDKHSNPHIDISMTDQNIDLLDDGTRNYEKKCKVYDAKVKALEKNVKRLKPDRVTMVGIEIPIPNEIPDDQVELFTKLSFGAVGDLVGYDNIIAVDTHVEEQHEYIDGNTGKDRLSMRHIHFATVPGVDGALNGKKFVTRSRMVQLNNEIENICQNQFGCRFMTGEKIKSNETVEALKIKSDRKALDRQREAQEQEQERLTKYNQVNQKNKAFNDRHKAINDKREADLQNREADFETYRAHKIQELEKQSQETEKKAQRYDKAVADMSALWKQTQELIKTIKDEKKREELNRNLSDLMAKGEAVEAPAANSYDRSIV